MASDAPTLLGGEPAEGVAFRWSTYDVPFWARGNTREGRWNRLGDDPTQYWSLSPDAAWAELIRHEGLTTEGELDLVRMPLWVCRFATARIEDLRVSCTRARLGVDDGQLLDDDWTACQELRARLPARVAGLIAPCVALPDQANLTLFGARRAIAFDRRAALASAVPATRAAIGRPPAGLLVRVRRRDRQASDRLF